MKKTILFQIMAALLWVQYGYAQDCKTNAELDAIPGKYLTAAQYPWPAVRAEYFNKLATAADKAMAKQKLGQIEKIEQQSHNGFTLTGGNWENIYDTEGYGYAGNTKLGKYTFQAALYELFCAKGKPVRNSEYSSVLRIYVNAIPVNTLSRFINNPFGSSMGDYDFGLQYMDWKNHKPADVNAQLISLFTYFSCNSNSLIDAINSGENYFQDVPEKDIKPNNRNNYIYRYWFIKKKDIPVVVPVSRKEYLQSLLEYYDREKLYFLKLIAELTSNHDKSIERNYGNWEADVADKIAVVKKVLGERNEEWLAAPALINRMEDASQNYKAKLKERTNYNRFWKFYDNDNKSETLYKYNPAYFKTTSVSAKPQLATIAFRYVTMPSSLRILNNFTKNFDFDALKKLFE
ncbi:hypothetical protein I5M32_10890 [Pedobacter sp. SD-b]|uniref:Uncharacterized protein n=1 Tax=Pedobacter segetis TaxID=2793069 RepID=A0ABS1BKP2_9SPHI|nr:hypothetical protein [Pedobacter segetis]MBK0383465.1 hypothetical protein [Pedobacter segetis]